MYMNPERFFNWQMLPADSNANQWNCSETPFY